MKTPTYAVVDIETTGGNVSSGDRIIQFGCALVEDHKVVQQFSIDINPSRKIPKEIEYLTGITTQSVAAAPYFEDVAPTLYQLLEGCIFVAHNIQFDYAFLSNEFERCGLPALTLKGMDTVELAQILLPTEASFSLGDLVASLGLTHDRPHQADSDALATAELFLLLSEKVETLPLVTVEKLVELSQHGIMQNQEFFLMHLAEMKRKVKPLPDHLFIKSGLALQKKNSSLPQEDFHERPSFPESIEDKKRLFGSALSIREPQVQMMDEIYRYFSKKETKHYAIEAATGVGKTIGYLLPAAYLASKENPIVISTYTTLLQKQLVTKDVAQVCALLPFELSVAVLKSKSHYLHLMKFESLLNEPIEQKLEAVYRMRVLVWLTETTTGDLDELNLTNYEQAFWNKVKHRGWLDEAKEDKWYEDDFYIHARKQVKKASIIVTNHAFLCHDLIKEQQELPPLQRLIVDEAHHLEEVAVQSTAESLKYYRLQKIFKWLGKKDDEKSFIGQFEAISSRMTEPITHFLDHLEMTSYFLNEEWSFFIDHLLHEARNQKEIRFSGQESTDVFFDPETFQSVSFKKSVKKMISLMEEIIYLSRNITEKMMKEKTVLSSSEQYLLNDFYDLLNEFQQQNNLFRIAFKQKNEQYVTWFSFKEKSPKNSFTIYCNRIDNPQILKKELVDKIPSIVYTGATLQVNDSFLFFEQQIGENNLKTLCLDSPYDYQKQVRFWLPKDLKPIRSLSKEQYAKMIVYYLELLSQNSTENVLVLFTSYDTLQRVYYQLQRNSAFSGRELLAQGISGSRERMLKRFFRSQGSILLGAASFWEGVDLPGRALQVLVVTRLPFDSPDRPFVKAKYQWLEKQHLHPFAAEALPKATLRLKQGLGRLIRSEKDNGILLLLDDRIVSTTYGRSILSAMPKGLHLEEMTAENMQEEIRTFLRE